MSSFYKRLIARKIVRGILSDHGPVDVRHLERRLERIIRVQPVLKNYSSNDTQLAVDLQSFAKCLNRNSLSVDQIKLDDGIDLQVKNDVVHFRTEPSQFTKKVVEEVWSDRGGYGYKGLAEDPDNKERVCVEFSSPNIAKPFHVGHMRSTIIGNIISNLYEAAGHDVKRINFMGDWGTQFGLLSLGLMRHVDIDHLKADPLQELFSVYVKINQEVKSECGEASELTSDTYKEGMNLFTRLEQGDESMKSVWNMVKNLSTAELNHMYQRLGVHFTHTLQESDYRDKTQEILQHLSEAGLLQFDEHGIGYVEVANQESIGRAVVVKSDGSSLYLTRDIASALDRQEKFSFDRVHYVVEKGQRGHFTKLVSILNGLGVPWAERPVDDIHIPFGRVKGMSTRQGNVVFLRDVLDEARDRVLESMASKSTTQVAENAESVADALGVAAIILQDVKSRRTNDYTFSWEQMLNFKSDSGVFVQYCHARLCSMLSNCGLEVTDDVDPGCLNDVELQRVALHLARYPDVFEDALTSLEPHIIVQYLFKLCHLTNMAYANCPVKGENADVAQARLLLFMCSKQVLANCLQVLGLRPLECI